MALLLIVKRLFFSGTIGIMWYMLGVIYAMILVKVMLEHMNEIVATIISILIYLIGLLGGSYYHLLDSIQPVQRVIDLILSFTGHFYLLRVPAIMMIGYWISKLDVIQRVKNKRTFLIAVYLTSIGISLIERDLCIRNALGNGTPALISSMICPTALFILISTFDFPSNMISSIMGESSGMIYFTHWQIKTIFESMFHSTGWACMSVCIIIGVILHLGYRFIVTKYYQIKEKPQ